MRGIATPKLLVILLALTSLLTTGLIALVVLKQRSMERYPFPDDVPGGGQAAGPLLLDSPLALPTFELIDSEEDVFGSEQLKRPPCAAPRISSAPRRSARPCRSPGPRLRPA